jgi:plastocyanin
MKIFSGALSAFALLLAAGIPAAAQTPAPAVVHIANFAFNPQTLNVAPGQTVTFVNDDSEPHTATAVDKSFDSEGLDLHETWHHVFSKPGTYAYFCEMHPYMHGTIVVGTKSVKS